MTSSHRLVAAALLVAVAALAVVFGGLAPLVLPLSFVAWLGLPAGEHAPRIRALVAAAGALALVGSVRFLASFGVQGIVEAGGRAVSSAGLSRQRELLFLEDRARLGAFVDPDGDGIGSALRVDELASGTLRTGRRLDAPPFESRAHEVRTASAGPALKVGGFFYRVCLPLAGGGLGARPQDAVDEERAERAYLLYGWPAVPATDTVGPTFVVDQDERILFTTTTFVGLDDGPPCDAALDEAGRFVEAGGRARRGVEWSIFKRKKPRPERPGDRAPR